MMTVSGIAPAKPHWNKINPSSAHPRADTSAAVFGGPGLDELTIKSGSGWIKSTDNNGNKHNNNNITINNNTTTKQSNCTS